MAADRSTRDKQLMEEAVAFSVKSCPRRWHSIIAFAVDQDGVIFR